MEFGTLVAPSSPLYARLIKTLKTLCGVASPFFRDPLPLNGEGLSIIGHRTHWAHESSLDAEQSLMLVLSDGAYFFLRNREDANRPTILQVDQSSVFFPCVGNPSQHQHQTLLDGEFVYSYHYNKSVFYVHDSLWVNSKRTIDLPLSKRLELFRDQFIQPLRSRYPTELDEASLPFVVLGKEYTPVDRLQTLFTAIALHADPKGVRIVYKNGKRYNENKGLMFVPEAQAYTAQRFEWLWPELFAVVFHVKVEQSLYFTLSLSLPGTDTLSPYRTVNFEDGNSRLLTDLNGAKEAKIFCIHSDGEFRYLYPADPELPVASFVDVLKYMEEVSTVVSKKQLEAVVQRAAQLKAHRHSSHNSPGHAKSPLLSGSPDLEVVTESPVGRPDSFSHNKRPHYEENEEERETKRPRVARPEFQ